MEGLRPNRLLGSRLGCVWRVELGREDEGEGPLPDTVQQTVQLTGVREKPELKHLILDTT